MTPRPGIFVSAVSKELKAARQLVSNTLQFLGYEPVWQDIFGTEQGDLRAMLREKIDDCKGVVQLVGRCYGAEPPAPDPQFGRVSYTQYEALYARSRGKKVWYLFLDEGFAGDVPVTEPAELQELQSVYRRQLEGDSHLRYRLNSPEALEASVLKLRDDLTRLRRGVKQWAAAVIVLLVVLVGAVIWIKSGQRQQTQQLTAMREEMVKMRQAVAQFPEVQGRVRQEKPGQNSADLQRRTYAELASQLGVDPQLLREKLPQFAKELQIAPDATTYERANAAYVNADYLEARRLALVAAHEAQTASPPMKSDAIKALELAGKASVARIEYGDALRHFREAEKLAERKRDPLEWAGLQSVIADVLLDQAQYGAAEKLYRNALAVYQPLRGEDDITVLWLRDNLGTALDGIDEYAAAEKEFREVLAIRQRTKGPDDLGTLFVREDLANTLENESQDDVAEMEFRDVLAIRLRVLGPEHPDTLTSRNNLANVLDDEGQHATAEKEYRDVLAIRTRVLGPENPDTLTTRKSLADTLNEQGEIVAAKKEYEGVLAIQERVLGSQHPDALNSRVELAGCQLLLRDFDGALATAEAGLDVDHSNLALVLKRAEALLFLGRTHLAEQIYLQHRGEKIEGDSPEIWQKGALRELHAFEAHGFKNPEIARIEGLLSPKGK